MEFSNLAEAIATNNKPEVSKLINNLRPRLIRFLCVHMNAEEHDAEDCVQQAFLKGIEAIKEENLRQTDQILSFFLTSCRNNYLNLQKKNHTQPFKKTPPGFGHQPYQLQKLLDKEQKQHLEECLQQLSERYREFIDYWFSFPDSDATAAATHFEISVSNAWTRKHRIIKKLSKCYQKKIKN